jgi:hypothetical protein
MNIVYLLTFIGLVIYVSIVYFLFYYNIMLYDIIQFIGIHFYFLFGGIAILFIISLSPIIIGIMSIYYYSKIVYNYLYVDNKIYCGEKMEDIL